MQGEAWVGGGKVEGPQPGVGPQPGGAKNSGHPEVSSMGGAERTLLGPAQDFRAYSRGGKPGPVCLFYYFVTTLLFPLQLLLP